MDLFIEKVVPITSKVLSHDLCSYEVTRHELSRNLHNTSRHLRLPTVDTKKLAWHRYLKPLTLVVLRSTSVKQDFQHQQYHNNSRLGSKGFRPRPNMATTRGMVTTCSSILIPTVLPCPGGGLIQCASKPEALIPQPYPRQALLFPFKSTLHIRDLEFSLWP